MIAQYISLFNDVLSVSSSLYTTNNVVIIFYRVPAGGASFVMERISSLYSISCGQFLNAKLVHPLYTIFRNMLFVHRPKDIPIDCIEDTFALPEFAAVELL
jgi:hypothetical protein